MLRAGLPVAFCVLLLLAPVAETASGQDARPAALEPGRALPLADSLRPHTATWRLLRTVDGQESELATMHGELVRDGNAWRYAVTVQLGQRQMSYRYWFATGTLAATRSIYDDSSGYADVAWDGSGVTGSIAKPETGAVEPVRIERQGGFYEAGTVGFVLALAGLDVGDSVALPSVDLHERQAGTIRSTVTARTTVELPGGPAVAALVVDIEQLGGTRSRQWLLSQPPYWSTIVLGDGDTRWELVEVRFS